MNEQTYAYNIRIAIIVSIAMFILGCALLCGHVYKPAEIFAAASDSDADPVSANIVKAIEYEKQQQYERGIGYTTHPEKMQAGNIRGDGNYVITRDLVNVRRSPSTDAELVTRAKKGDRFIVFDQKISDGVVWFLVKTPQGGGYISGGYGHFDGKLKGVRAYLTFDDGPSENTKKILDILDRYGVKATFFVIYHSNSAELYKEIINRGHVLALHSYTHDYKTIYSSEAAFFDDLDKLAKYVKDVTGFSPTITRFPGGSSNTISRKYSPGIMSRLSKSVPEHGYHYFDWNVDSGDASGNGIPSDRLIANVRANSGYQADAVVLMHDTMAKSTTVDALPAIIEVLQNKGYEIVPITESTPEVHHAVLN